MDDFVADLGGPDQIADPGMKKLYHLWDHKRSLLSYFPAWQDFTIAEIAGIMPQMAVVDHLPRENRFRVRFSGSMYDSLLGHDITGWYFDKMPDAHNLESRARRVCMGQPLLVKGLPLTWARQAGQTYMAMILPMQTNPGGKADQLLYMVSVFGP